MKPPASSEQLSILAEPWGRIGAAETPAVSVELPEGYYVDNFLVVLRTVEQRYEDLLSDEELSFVAGFRQLSQGAQRLYVRLIMRKGPCFRLDRLHYIEIEDVAGAVAELRDRGFLDGAEDDSVELLWALLLRDELLELVRELGIEPRDARRSALVNLLRDMTSVGEESSEAVERAIRKRLDVIRPVGESQLWVLRLLFFGNLYQDWTEFVLRDLGIVRYEAYPLHHEQRLFDRREVIDQALEVGLGRSRLEAMLSAGDLDQAHQLALSVLAGPAGAGIESWLGRARRDADRILSRVARALERAGKKEESLPLYSASIAPPARERRCRVLVALDRAEEALVLCEEMGEEPLDDTEVAFAAFFAHRIRRQLGLTQEPWRRPKRPVETLEIAAVDLASPRQSSAEELALGALEAAGRPGIYSENWLWRSLFGLSFWDVVFAPLPGVFAHQFQLGPLDLSTPEFFRARQEAIVERLETLRVEPHLGPRLLAVYDTKVGIANRLVSWHPALRPVLEFVLHHLPGHALATVCDRLVRHLGRHRRGLPDLLVLAPDSPIGLELLEVKAPGDQLRPEQGAWIDYLNEHGLPAKVLKLKPSNLVGPD